MNAGPLRSRRSLTVLVMAVSLVAASIGASGCAGVGPLPSPSADVSSVRVSWIGLDAIGIEFGLTVKNPYPTELPLIALDYALSSNDHRFLEGTATLDQRIPARSTTDIAVPLRLPYRALLEVGQEVTTTHSLPYHASLGLHVAAPVIGEIRLPIEKDAQLTLPRS